MPGFVALDGTRLKANASRHEARSHDRMVRAEGDLAAEVEAWLRAAEAADAGGDAEHGQDRRGDEMPAWVTDEQRRLERIRAAKAALEAKARAAAEAKAASGAGDGERPCRGRKPKHDPTPPKPSAQRNFTDAESRIMEGKDGFIQADNGQRRDACLLRLLVAFEQLGREPAVAVLRHAKLQLTRRSRQRSGPGGRWPNARIRLAPTHRSNIPSRAGAIRAA